MSKIEYKDLLYQISEKLDESELPRLIFMCSEEIPETSVENIRNVLALFKELEKHNRLGIDLLDILKEILKQMKKRSLLKKVEEFETRRKAQSVGIVTSLKRLATCIKGAVKLVCNFRTIAGGLLVVGSGMALRSCSSLDEFVEVFNKVVLVSISKLVEISEGSLCFTVQAETSSALKELWDMYKSGTLQNRLQEFLVTDEIKQLASGEDVEATVYIDEQEYKAAYLDLMLVQKEESDVTEEDRLGGRRHRKSDSFLYFKRNEDDVTLLKLNLERQRRQFLEKENKKLRAEIAIAERVQTRLVCQEQESIMSYSRNTKRGYRPPSLSVEVRIPIPKDKVGLIIGKKGKTVQKIRYQTGVEIEITDNHAHLRGTTEQCNKAREEIEDILKSAREKDSSSQGGFRKLDMVIPERFMGQVIGKGREKLSNIETKTGVALKIIDNNLCIKGSKEQEKKVIREIKPIVNLAIARSSRNSALSVSIARLAYVDTAQLEENHEFELSSTSLKARTGENCFKLQLLEHPLQEETSFDLADTESLKEEILKVLKQIHKEKEEEMIKVDMWCHFGHAYVTKVEEAEETETFTLKEIKEKIGSGDGTAWKPFFKEGMERIEVEQIEKDLPSSTAKEDIRYDFTFYTPSCREVRVKAWLIEEGEEENNGAASLAFSRSAPVPVKNILTQVLSDEHSQTEDASKKPCFHICSKFQQRMKVDILILSKGFDCRLSIRTCPDVSKTPEAEEEDKILESYLMGMKIEEGQLVLPPVSARPDGFDLFYRRRSLRKTYQYGIDGEQFSLTVCKDQAHTVDTDETVVKSFDETPTMTDVHLHCEEWDRLLDEGDWEPQEIAAKLPTFLQFLRKVQRNVAPQATAVTNK